MYNPFLEVEDGSQALVTLGADGTPLPPPPANRLDIPRSQLRKSEMAKTLNEMLVAEGLQPSNFEINGQKISRLERIVQRLYDAAELGEQWAINAVFDRIIGKPTQAVEITSQNQTVMIVKGVSMGDL